MAERVRKLSASIQQSYALQFLIHRRTLDPVLLRQLDNVILESIDNADQLLGALPKVSSNTFSLGRRLCSAEVQKQKYWANPIRWSCCCILTKSGTVCNLTEKWVPGSSFL